MLDSWQRLHNKIKCFCTDRGRWMKEHSVVFNNEYDAFTEVALEPYDAHTVVIVC